MKEIRRQIAAANDIDLVVAECHYKGDCPGTCPKCEAEVRELEQALERRRLAGKAVSLLGISAGLLATAPEEAMAEAAESEKEMDLRDTVAVKDGAQEGWELAGKVAPAPALVRRVVDGEGKVLGEHRGLVRYTVGQRRGARWYTAGSRSKKKGHPHHPLYLRKDSPLEDFNGEECLDQL